MTTTDANIRPSPLSPLLTQVFGTLLVAAIVGGIAVWGTTQLLEDRLRAVSADIERLRTELHEIRRDFYRPRYGDGADRPTALILPAGRP